MLGNLPKGTKCDPVCCIQCVNCISLNLSELSPSIRDAQQCSVHIMRQSCYYSGYGNAIYGAIPKSGLSSKRVAGLAAAESPKSASPKGPRSRNNRFAKPPRKVPIWVLYIQAAIKATRGQAPASVRSTIKALHSIGLHTIPLAQRTSNRKVNELVGVWPVRERACAAENLQPGDRERAYPATRRQ